MYWREKETSNGAELTYHIDLATEAYLPHKTVLLICILNHMNHLAYQPDKKRWSKLVI